MSNTKSGIDYSKWDQLAKDLDSGSDIDEEEHDRSSDDEEHDHDRCCPDCGKHNSEFDPSLIQIPVPVASNPTPSAAGFKFDPAILSPATTLASASAPQPASSFGFKFPVCY